MGQTIPFLNDGDLVDLLKGGGFKVIGTYGSLTGEPLSRDSSRIALLAVKALYSTFGNDSFILFSTSLMDYRFLKPSPEGGLGAARAA
ncbi:MAG: hypothetical protein WB392_06310, partial [Methanotrichaceae archaeon]